MKKITATLNMIILFGSIACGDVSASTNSPFNPASINYLAFLDNAIKSINPTGLFLVKSGPYKESDDPLMRRGTQNTDYPQGMFLILPAALTAIFFIVLFVRKKK